MAPTWKCMDCGRTQANQELQCECGNIDPIGFEEVDIFNEEDHPDPVTMVEETPVVETEALVVEDVEPEEVATPKKPRKQKKTSKKPTRKSVKG